MVGCSFPRATPTSELAALLFPPPTPPLTTPPTPDVKPLITEVAVEENPEKLPVTFPREWWR